MIRRNVFFIIPALILIFLLGLLYQNRQYKMGNVVNDHSAMRLIEEGEKQSKISKDKIISKQGIFSAPKENTHNVDLDDIAEEVFIEEETYFDEALEGNLFADDISDTKETIDFFETDSLPYETMDRIVDIAPSIGEKKINTRQIRARKTAKPVSLPQPESPLLSNNESRIAEKNRFQFAGKAKQETRYKSLESGSALRNNKKADLKYQAARGYWKNTYIPGSPLLRQLHHRLFEENKHRALLKNIKFAKPIWQPFDSPSTSAMTVYLHSNVNSLQGSPQRIYLQIGLQANHRHSASRPPMNIALVVDPRNINLKQYKIIRSILTAFLALRTTGDSISLTLANKHAKTMIQPGNFRHGSLTLALQKIAKLKTSSKSTLQQAVSKGFKLAKQNDDNTAPLGSTLLVLIIANTPSYDEQRILQTMAHQNAVDGIPSSIITAGKINRKAINAIVLAGQGHLIEVNEVAMAKKAVDLELSAISRVIARAIRLRIRLNSKVKLVNILGSYRLDKQQSQQVRDMENSIDSRLSKNLGITSDRNKDDDGIQIIIPAFYAADHHVILLDIVASQAGSLADVEIKYKDLIFLKNARNMANISLSNQQKTLGPLEYNVRKNVLAYQLSTAINQAGIALSAYHKNSALRYLTQYHNVLNKIIKESTLWANDQELNADKILIQSYLDILVNNYSPNQRKLLADILSFSSYSKQYVNPLP